MKPLSASAAAKAVGKSIPTITRAIKSGKISAKSLDSGGYEIDPSELFRVYPAVTRNPNVKSNALENESSHETRKLQAKIEVLQAEKLEAAQARIAELEKERDKWQEQAERALRIITDQRQPDRANTPTPEHAANQPQEAPRKRKGFFGWLTAANA